MAAPKGNKNAVAKGRKRVDVHASLAGERLARFELYLKKICDDDAPFPDDQIAVAARQMLYEWIDKLEV